MMQGDSYKIPIEILAEDGVVDPTVLSEVEVVLGRLVKTLSSGAISYDASKQEFLVPVSQKETMYMPQTVRAQVRVKLKDSEDVIGIDLGEIDVTSTLSKVVL